MSQLNFICIHFNQLSFVIIATIVIITFKWTMYPFTMVDQKILLMTLLIDVDHDDYQQMLSFCFEMSMMYETEKDRVEVVYDSLCKYINLPCTNQIVQEPISIYVQCALQKSKGQQFFIHFKNLSLIMSKQWKVLKTVHRCEQEVCASQLIFQDSV